MTLLMFVKECQIPSSDNYKQDFFTCSFKSYAGFETILHCAGLLRALQDVKSLSAPTY